jgi:hypothetical protein
MANHEVASGSTSDRGAHVVDDATLHLLVDLETRKAQRLRYLVSVVALAISSDGTTLEGLARLLARGIRATDCIAVRDNGSLTVLLVDADVADLPMIVGRMTGTLSGEAWSAGAACYPNTATAPGQLLSQARTLQVEAQKDGGHRVYVAKVA